MLSRPKIQNDHTFRNQYVPYGGRCIRVSKVGLFHPSPLQNYSSEQWLVCLTPATLKKIPDPSWHICRSIGILYRKSRILVNSTLIPKSIVVHIYVGTSYIFQQSQKEKFISIRNILRNQYVQYGGRCSGVSKVGFVHPPLIHNYSLEQKLVGLTFATLKKEIIRPILAYLCEHMCILQGAQNTSLFNS